jgi:hypothetical protein
MIYGLLLGKFNYIWREPAIMGKNNKIVNFNHRHLACNQCIKSNKSFYESH